MIRMVLEKRAHRGLPDISCPKLYCDYCAGPIEDHRLGMYLWNAPAEHEGPTDIYTVHKGECDHYLELQLGWAEWETCTEEIEVLPVYLAANMGLVPDKDWSNA